MDKPGLDGLGVSKKAREAAAAIGVVLISAHESELERASDFPGGNVETLPKPLVLGDLRSKVAKVRVYSPFAVNRR